MFCSIVLVLGSLAAAHGGLLGYPGLISYAAAPAAVTSHRSQYHYQATHDPIVVARPIAAPVAVSYAAAPAVSYAATPAVSYAAAPIAPVAPWAAAPVAPWAYAKAYEVPNQYHSQNHLGEAAYGYSFSDQAHSVVRDHAGGVTGSYSYIDSEGKPVEVNYKADSLNGFQVSSNILPVAPKVDLVQPENTLKGPEPVEDTPEVKAARAEHLKAVEEAKARASGGDDDSSSRRRKRSVALALAPAPAHYAVAAPTYLSAAPTFLSAAHHYPAFAAAPWSLGYYRAALAPAVVPAPAYVRSILEPLKPIEGKVVKYSFTAGDQDLLQTTTEASSSEA